MFKLQLRKTTQTPDILLSVIFMLIVVLNVAAMLIFNQLIIIHVGSKELIISASLLTYVFLYPICFLVLRLYGYHCVNRMIVAMFIASFIFVLICMLVTSFPVSNNQVEALALYNILKISLKMYLVGLIGIPAGIYASFLTLRLLSSINIGFNVLSLSIATIVGEFFNTLIVYPLGFHSEFSLSSIFNRFVVDAILFKSTMGIILSVMIMIIINLIIKYRINNL